MAKIADIKSSSQAPQAADRLRPSPVLVKALASLSVGLDDELARYRYAKRHGNDKLPTRRLILRPQPQRSPELMDVQTLGAVAAPVQPEQGRPGPQSNLGLPPVPPPSPGFSGGGDGVDEQELGEPPVGEHPGTALVPHTPIPDDYLESTEALLRSRVDVPGLDADESGEAYEPSVWTRLSTPLGVGALLAMLVGSGMAGYLLTNPAAIRHLWPQRSDTAAVGESVGADAGLPGENPLAPNLAQDEFEKLSLSSLNTLPQDVQGDQRRGEGLLPDALLTEPTEPASEPDEEVEASQNSPAPSTPLAAAVRIVPAQNVTPRSPAPPAQEAVPPATADAPDPSPPVSATPARAAVSAEEAPQAERPTVQAAGAVEYFVVADYTGDGSLTNARSQVGDAYVRNFPMGARIQLGAFQEEGSAQDLVQQLEQSGIVADVYASP